MTRKTARQIAVQLLFSMETNRISPNEAMKLFFSEEHYSSLSEEDDIYRELPDTAQMDYIQKVTEEAAAHLGEIDAVISRYSKAWKRERLSKTTLAILRCAICEILYLDDIPDSAAINEAVELGKYYDSPQAAAFINGLLGSFLKAEVTIQSSESAQPPGEEAEDA